jgi:hypothetical protein
MTPDGMENPAFNINPGDLVILNIANHTSAAPVTITEPSGRDEFNMRDAPDLKRENLNYAVLG